MRLPWQERRYDVKLRTSSGVLEVGSVTLEELRSLSFQDVFGQGLDFESINSTSMERAVSLVPVYACTRFIADSIAAMPLQAYRIVGDEQSPIRSEEHTSELQSLRHL